MSAAAHNWYAVRTHANREQVVQMHLSGRDVENFLPTCRAPRIARRGSSSALRPLVPGYVFARFPLTRRVDVLSVPGAAYLLSDSNGPVPVPNSDIEMLRVVSDRCPAEPAAWPEAGRWVRIGAGMLAGVNGIVEQVHGVTRVTVRVHSLRSAFTVELNAADVVSLVPVAAPAASAAGGGQ